MSLVFRIDAQGSWHDLQADDFPLPIAVVDRSDIVVGEAAAASPDAWLGLDHERGLVFIQPAIQINGDLLTVSGWLSAGDQVRIAGAGFAVARIDGILSLVPAASAPQASADPPQHQLSGAGHAAAVVDPRPATEADEATTFADRSARRTRSVRRALGGVFLLLLAGVFFVLAAAPVEIDVTPAPESLSLSGVLPAVKIGERYLVFPGTYEVRAQRSGFRDLTRLLDIDFGSRLSVAFQMQKLPGWLDIRSPPVDGAQVRIDGSLVGSTPLSSIELEAGQYELSITLDRYLPHKQTLVVEGMGERQVLDVELQPAWGTVTVVSEPPGADVWLDGEAMGKTPLKLEPMPGQYTLKIAKDGWRSASAVVPIESGTATELPVFRLAKSDAVLKLSSKPDGARVRFDDRDVGKTPLDLELVTGKQHVLKVSKPGFVTQSHTVSAQRGAVQALDLDLKPEFGIVFITSKPADARLKVDDKVVGSASRRLRLTTRAHRIEISKPGYDTYTTTVTPNSTQSTKLDVRLDATGPNG